MNYLKKLYEALKLSYWNYHLIFLQGFFGFFQLPYRFLARTGYIELGCVYFRKTQNFVFITSCDIVN